MKTKQARITSTLDVRGWMLDVALTLLLLSCASASAATRYVWQSSPNPAPPYTNWTSAAHVIQDAVDAAQTGDTVLVAGGGYATGGRAVSGTMTNRVAIDRAITVESLMGPEVTIIQGYQVPGTTNGDGAIRCAYLANGSSLSGFTLTNGATQRQGDDYIGEQSGGGLWCESASVVVSNCVLTGNSAIYGGGAFRGTLSDCTLSRNSASSAGGGADDATLNNCLVHFNTAGMGGGVFGSKLNHCTLNANFARSGGGGAYTSTLNNCTLSSNSVGIYAFYDGGGGASSSTLSNCTLTGNSAPDGGGTFASVLNRCTLSSNSAFQGGGAAGGSLTNCTLTGNSASYGGGASFAPGDWTPISVTLNNCTLTGNWATNSGGGVVGVYFGGFGALNNNCIFYFNTATNGANYSDVTLHYCCTTPQPSNGFGNITNAPLFVDYAGGNLRLQSNSPCINAGLNAYAPGPTDLDGLPRIVSGTVDIGAYEFQGPGSVISYAWLQQYGLPTDGSADATDPDADGHNTWQEWRCLTDPTNALSVLRLLSASRAGTNVTVSWQSVAGVNYFLERSTNLWASPPFTLLAPNLPGQPGTTTYTDPNAATAPRLFYRVGVRD